MFQTIERIIAGPNTNDKWCWDRRVTQAIIIAMLWSYRSTTLINKIYGYYQNQIGLSEAVSRNQSITSLTCNIPILAVLCGIKGNL